MASRCEKLLGIHTDIKLTFELYVRSLCIKDSQKLNAFARIAYYLKFEQRKLLLNALIISQFSIMLSSYLDVSQPRFNINYIHERTLRTVYQDHN